MGKMMRPLVFIHTGKYRYYLEYVLRQARKHNPKREIVLLLGNRRKIIRYRGLANIHLIDVSDRDFVSFCNVYQHLSSNPYDFERFCFLRWICCKRFLADSAIDSCYVFDSDVMIYNDLSYLDDIVDREGGCDYAGQFYSANAVSPGVTFITLSYLSELCEFLLSSYSGETYAIYRKHYNDLLDQKKAGGVCDMIALSLFRDKAMPRLRTLDLIDKIDGGCFDIHINQATQGDSIPFDFVMKNGIKNIEFKGGIPYCFDKIRNKELAFSTLHFQGGTKRLIPLYYTGNPFPLQFVHMIRRCLKKKK